MYINEAYYVEAQRVEEEAMETGDKRTREEVEFDEEGGATDNYWSQDKSEG